MKKDNKLVFATNNMHKLEEAKRIISDEFEILSLREIGCHDEIPETADTLEGNALIKARWVRDRYGYDCFADDTGLMVDALDGAPGVYSARYAGDPCTPAENVSKMLCEMAGKENRAAHFSTAIALSLGGEEHIFEGRVEGSIATEPHGDGGFGYDPIFIAAESGKCFAEMTGEEKDAISHRGRAMRKLRDYLAGILTIMIICIVGMTVRADDSQWRLHASYDGYMHRVVDTPSYVYFLGTRQEYNPSDVNASTFYGILFRYDKEDGAIEYLNSSNILSGSNAICISYNYDKNYLVVAHEDGNIDIIDKDDAVTTITGLRVADSSLNKGVNDITFDETGRYIYLATNFGYIVIDASIHEVSTSRVFNRKINSVIPYNGKIWVATDQGLYCGDPKEFDFERYQQISSQIGIESLNITNNWLYFLYGARGNKTCGRVDNSGETYTTKPVSDPGVVFFSRSRSGMILVYNWQIITIDEAGKLQPTTLPKDYYFSNIGSIDGKTLWVSTQRKGICSLRIPEHGGEWTILTQQFFPNASTAFQCSYMEYSPTYGMLVRNHGFEYIFSSRMILTNDLISGYKDMTWTPLSTTYRTDMPGLLIDSPFGISIDPNNPDHVYCGSERSGLLRLDLKDPTKSIHMSMSSDMLGGNGKDGFAVIVPDNPDGTWKEQCVFAAPSFDNSGNLWTAFVNPEPGVEVSSYTELWMWSAADRASSTTASNVHGWKQFKFDNLLTGNTPKVKALHGSKNKNIVMHCGNTTTTPILIWDHNGTIDNRSDDRTVQMKNLYDQDGNKLDFYYVIDWYEDVNTGLVWVSYGDGLFTFDPQTIFEDPTSVRRIKVPRNDGTGLADYLLSGVTVNSIATDASGRKWFGTNGAGLVCTTSDGREIISTFTPDNSPLPGSSVFAVCYNPKSGSLMISTDKGLCEYFIPGGSSGDSDSGLKCYPNPVRPDYFGYVTIEGLSDQAMVKIVDIGGNLIKECGQAVNGVARWDVTNMFCKRVPSGVYTVIASNGPQEESYNKTAKIVVVN